MTQYVVDVMTKGPITIGPDVHAANAEHLSALRSVHHLLVMDGYKLVGIVCPCDLYSASAQASVSEYMHRAPITIDDQETAEAAWDVMAAHGVGCLPVTDWTGSLRGVITRRDLRRAGIVGPDKILRCAACGSTHGLRPSVQEDVLFCVRCLDGSGPCSDIDEVFITLGGGG